MGNFSPASFPRRPKQSTPAIKLHYTLSKLYYRYEIVTGQYIMSSGEKLAYNLVVLSILALLLSAVFYCLPRSIIVAVQRLVFFLTGAQKLRVNRVDVLTAPTLLQTGMDDAAASLVVGLGDLTGPFNVTTVFAS